jgi:hypothetical protein
LIGQWDRTRPPQQAQGWGSPIQAFMRAVKGASQNGQWRSGCASRIPDEAWLSVMD